MQPKLYALSLLLLAAATSFLHAQPGSPNASFGHHGLVQQSFRSNGNAFSETATGLIHLPNGQALLALGVNDKSILTRLHPNGTTDSAYGTGGYSDYARIFNGLPALLPDGSVLLAGTFSGTYSVVRYDAAGRQDLSFGNKGTSVTTFVNKLGPGPAPVNLMAVAVQPDGRILLAGQYFNGANSDFLLVRLLPNGAPDLSFGAAGTRITDFGTNEFCAGLALQPDGKILLTGGITTPNGLNNMAVARWHPDGSVDFSFAGTGRVLFTQPFSQGATAVDVQPDGKILVAGGSRDFTVVRYHPDGTPDLGFGSMGVAVADLGAAQENVRSMALLENGGILLAGDLTYPPLNVLSGLALFLPNGLADAGFGNGGKASFAGPQQIRNVTGVQCRKDGTIDVTGAVQPGGGMPRDYALFRCTPDGQLDPTFGTKGQLTGFVAGERSEFRALAVQEDGKLVAGGFTDGSNDPDFALARYHADGKPDLSFGTNGKVIHNFGINDGISAMTLLKDGMILAAGTIRAALTPDNDFILARYQPDGSLDPSFGMGGRAISRLTTNSDVLSAMAVQADGGILAGGTTIATGQGGGQSFLLARYHPNGTLDNAFGQGGMVVSRFGYPQAALVSVKALPDGKILALARYLNPANALYNLMLVRLDATGAPDAGFGKDGIVITGAADFSVAPMMELGADGTISVTGSVNPNNEDIALMRFTADGTPDPAFGTGGKAVLDLGSRDFGLSVSTQQDGKVVLVGQSIADFGAKLVLARFHPNGTPDYAFGQLGKVVADVKGDAFFPQSVIADNRLYIAGAIRQLSFYGALASFVLSEQAQLQCPPAVVTGTDTGSCSAIVHHISPVVMPESALATVQYKLTGATTGWGTGSVSGLLFNKGVTTVTYSLPGDAAQACSFTVTVNDTEAPRITNLGTSVATLWPVNHKMKDVVVSYDVSDNCGPVTTTLTVSSNEAGSQDPDWEVVNDRLVRLRAERTGNGTGRVYTLTLKATDPEGHTTWDSVTVSVPRNMADLTQTVAPVTGKKGAGAVAIPGTARIDVLSNPTRSYFTLQLQGWEKGQPTTIRVTNAWGRLVETKYNVFPGQAVRIGSSYAPGIYFIEVVQGKERRQLKVTRL